VCSEVLHKNLVQYTPSVLPCKPLLLRTHFKTRFRRRKLQLLERKWGCVMGSSVINELNMDEVTGANIIDLSYS
jgi:hypothetical protein